MLTVSELEAFARDYMYKEFDLGMSIPIKLNGRLSRVLGRFRYSTLLGPLDIQLSKKLVLYNNDEKVLDVLKHELIHYALYQLKIPHNDTDIEFIRACNDRGVGLTGQGGFTADYHIYRCSDCAKEYHVRRRAVTRIYICKRCRTNLDYLGKKLVKTGI